jgi:lipopolysaccharide export system protein LptA
MKTIKLLLVLFLSLSCGLAWAQTNAPAATPVEQVLNVDSDSGYYDGITNQMVYLGHVVVVYNMKDTLDCERLTVDIPADHGNPTNIVAETNVVVDVLDENGGTNHLTAGKAVYSYQLLNPATNVVKSVTNVVYAITNELVTFTGGNPQPKLERRDATILDDMFVIDVRTRLVSWPGPHLHMQFKQISSPGKTNNSPFGLH